MDVPNASIPTHLAHPVLCGFNGLTVSAHVGCGDASPALVGYTGLIPTMALSHVTISGYMRNRLCEEWAEPSMRCSGGSRRGRRKDEVGRCGGTADGTGAEPQVENVSPLGAMSTPQEPQNRKIFCDAGGVGGEGEGAIWKVGR